MYHLLINAISETLVTVTISMLLSLFIGLCVGTIISQSGEKANTAFAVISNFISNLNFLLLTIITFPLVNFLLQKNFSTYVIAILPLTIAGSAFLSIQTVNIFKKVPKKILEDAQHFGASEKQLFSLIIWPECKKEIINVSAKCANLLLSLSVFAAVFGAGGLGHFALQEGFANNNYIYSLLAIFIILAAHHLIEYTSYLLQTKVTR